MREQTVSIQPTLAHLERQPAKRGANLGFLWRQTTQKTPSTVLDRDKDTAYNILEDGVELYDSPRLSCPPEFGRARRSTAVGFSAARTLDVAGVGLRHTPR